MWTQPPWRLGSGSSGEVEAAGSCLLRDKGWSGDWFLAQPELTPVPDQQHCPPHPTMPQGPSWAGDLGVASQQCFGDVCCHLICLNYQLRMSCC